MAENDVGHDVGDNLNLREMIHRKLRSVEQLLTQQTSNNLLDIPSFLETIETLMQCVVLLDSFETVSENVMRCLMQAHNLLWRNIDDITCSLEIINEGRPTEPVPLLSCA